MKKLSDYNQDGANYQARAVLAMLENFNVENSFDDDSSDYLAVIKVGRWENCREQGYVLMMDSIDHEKQLNIAFFEHRNSDKICALKWEQKTINTPTIDNAKFENNYLNDKYDVSFSVSFGQILEMSKWIEEQFENFWEETSTN